MNTEQIRNKLLAMFPDAAAKQISPIIDTLIDRAYADGKVAGRKESATILEVLVLGASGDVQREQLAEMMHTLRRD